MIGLKVQYVSGDKAWCFCPFHEDKERPNLSITLSAQYYGCYKCWACGRYGSLNVTQMDKLELPPKEYSYSKIMTPIWSKLAHSYNKKLQSLPLIQLGLAKELNVSVHTLNDWGVGYDGQAYTIPMYRFVDGEMCGIQRRFHNGDKRCMPGSHLGIMITQYLWLNPDEITFICEGFSDGVSIYDIGVGDVIARPTCHFNDIDECFSQEEYYDCIIIIPDNDAMGKAGAEELYAYLNKYVDGDIFTFEFTGAKDIREYIKLKGKQYVKDELKDFCDGL